MSICLKERILETHWNIAEAKVIGIPDEHYGEVPRAYVVLSNSKSTLTTPEMIKIYVRERVAPHKQLHGGVKIVVKLPRTASGKVRRPLTSDEFNC
ncbi:hypothetical protein AB6A40_006734 [Gnathostoma spinigerum]|uniref:AMP-binding enzyme C-terminal domain-containing protein n=1 Tax=Gnathostoma spinigerum TaxID=75299 RepID=A0ABD6EUV4_9BILA